MANEAKRWPAALKTGVTAKRQKIRRNRLLVKIEWVSKSVRAFPFAPIRPLKTTGI